MVELSDKAAPKCPVCGDPMSLEMMAVGKEKGSEKRTPKLDASIIQAVGYTLESAILALVGSGRAPMYVCNNSNCPECGKKFSVKTPQLSDKIPTASRRWDIGGIGVSLDKAIYKMTNKKRK